MKAPFRHLAWICVLLCGDVNGQAATYTVKPGDSLSKIARSQGCTVEALAKANDIKLSAVIQGGQKLKLPGKAAAAASDGSHIIQPGDTFSSISRQHGVSVESLLAANPGLDPKTLKPGQKLHLAATSTPTAAKTAAPPEKSPPAPTADVPENSAKTTAVERVPEPVSAASPAKKPDESSTTPAAESPEEKVRTVVVDAEMTFSEFATRHGTDIQRLNNLNGLDLTGATVLAKGSELYVPTRPQAE